MALNLPTSSGRSSLFQRPSFRAAAPPPPRFVERPRFTGGGGGGGGFTGTRYGGVGRGGGRVRPLTSRVRSRRSRMVEAQALPPPARLNLSKAGGGGGGGREKPRSLWQQLSQSVLGVPRGLVGLASDAIVTGVAPVRAGFDLLKDRDLRGDTAAESIMAYMPGPAKLGESFLSTGRRLTNPTQYGQAVEEGRIVDVLAEDIGNVALIGGAASKAIGTAGRTVLLPAEQAAAISPRGLRSVGAAVAEAVEPVGRIRAPLPPQAANLGNLTRLAPAADMVPVSIGRTGLAGMAGRAGMEGLERGLGRVGRGVKVATSLGEQAGNVPIWPYQAAAKLGGKALDVVGLPRPGALVGRAAARVAPGLAFGLTETGRRAAEYKAAIERSGVEAGRFAVGPARTAESLGLSPVEAGAALLAVDQPQFMEQARQLTDPELRQMLDRPEAFGGQAEAVRPTVELVRTFHDYIDRNLPDELLAKIDRVRDEQRQVADYRTARLVEERARPGQFQTRLGEVSEPAQWEQLGTDLRPSVVRREQGAVQRQRGPIQRQWEKESAAAIKARRLADATAAIANELPEPPSAAEQFRAGEAAGRFNREQTLGRRAHAAAQRSLNRAVNEYAALAEGAPPDVVRRAADRVDRLTEQAENLRQRIATAERRVDAATALTRVSGEVEAIPGEGGRPAPDVGGAQSVTQVRQRAQELGQVEAEAILGDFEVATGGSRMKLPPKGYKGGEYDWWDQVPQKVRRRLQRERWMGGAKGFGVEPDQLAAIMNDQLNTDLSPTAAALRYVDMIERYWEAQSGRSAAIIERVAQDLDMPVEQVAAALRGKLADYRGSLLDPVEQAIDDIRADYLALDADRRAQLDEALDVARQENLQPGEIGELIEVFLPAIDITGRAGLLSANVVDMGEVVNWMQKGDIAPTIRAVGAQRGAAQNMQLGRLAGDVQGARALAQQNVVEQRAARRDLNAAEQGAALAEQRAARGIDVAQEGVVANQPIEGPRVPAPGLPRAEFPRAGVAGEAPTYRSVERALRIRQGGTEALAAHHEARAMRLRKALDRADERIGNMETELGRSFQERLTEDVNRPAVVRVRSAVRKGGKKLGGLRGKGDDVWIDGELGRQAKKYGVYDVVLNDLVNMRDDMRRNAMRAGEHMEADYDMDFGAVTDLGGVPMDPTPPRDIADVLVQRIAERPEIVRERIDVDSLTDSAGAEQLLHDMALVLADETEAGLQANAPYRVMALLDATDWNMPADVRNAAQKAIDDYGRKRAKHLTTVMDDYAEAIPAKFRTITQNNRRQVGALLEMAEEANRKNPGSGDKWIRLAEESMTTLAELVEQGIDPTHLIGGREAPRYASRGGSRGGSLAQRKTRAETTRRTGLRPLAADAYARLEAAEAQTVIHNNTSTLIGQEFGKRADELPEVRQAQIEWDQRHPGEVMPTSEINRVVQDAGWSPVENTLGGGQSLVVPKPIKDQLRTLGDMNKWWRKLGEGNRMWKSWVLPFSTKWMTGNVIGNVIQASVHAGVSPATLVKRMRQIAKHEGGYRELWLRSGVPDWSPNQIANHGLSHNEWQIMRDTADREFRTKGGEKVGKAIGLSFKLNEFVDNLTRSAVYMEKIGTGVPPAAALDTTLRAMGDFTRMSPVERNIVREIVPFYAWLRHQTQAYLRLPVTSPTRAAFLMNLSTMYRDPDLSNDLLRVIGSKVPLGGDRFFDIGSVSPLPEGGELPFFPTQIGRAITPLIKLPIAAATGMDIGAWDQLSRPAGTIRRGPYGQEEATSPLTRLFSDPVRGLGELGYVAAGQAPAPIRGLRDLALGNEARYQTGYAIGDLENENMTWNRSLLRGLNLPAPYTVNIAEITRRARERIERQRG